MGTHLEVELRHRLSRLDLDVALSMERETVAVVGPSGAGKTTVLRAIAGLVKPQHGRIVHDGRVLLDTDAGVELPPEERSVGMVHQDGALFPFMTVERNVAYGVRGDKHERLRRARSVLERFGIAHLARARPGGLSGGERQRVALARAVAPGPSLLLLDEPLSALDAVTRSEVAAELEARVRELELPTIVVSHDFEDVLGLADRVAVLQSGHVVQSGSPAELVEAPASAFVATLAGVNYFAGDAAPRDGLTEVRGPGWSAALLSTDDLSGRVGVVVSPWEISLSPRRPEGSALNAVTGPVRRVITVGNRVRVSLDSTPPVVAEVTEDAVRHLGLAPGTPVVATWKATGTRLVRVPPDQAG